ncbi:MAG: elongation factor G [Bacteroidia bacterium]|nr:elongation factor G [Bacteroidia bacterium]
MKTFATHQIKNIAVVGSLKSGKTTLVETMLFESKTISRRGSVEEKNTVSDFHEIEHERVNSIFSSLSHAIWRDTKINILDTPGNDNFIGEINAALRVADTCVMVLSANHGVEVGTEIIWRQVDKMHKPTLIAVNQMDHEQANFQQTLEQAQARLGSQVTVMQYPYNSGSGFDSIIDLLKMIMYKFPADGGKPQKLPIPAEEKEKADELHNILVEAAAENDESLMELYFEKGALDEDELRQGLRIGIANRQVFPVFCMSARQNMGSGRMMGFIGNVCPSPEDIPEKTVSGESIPADSNAPLGIFVFKTSIEPHLGTVNFFKVGRGTMKTGLDLIDSRTENSERIGQLYVVNGKNKTAVEELQAGDLGATVKLKDVRTNDSLYIKGSEIKFAEIILPQSRIREAVLAQDKKDEEKLGEMLQNLKKQDPTLNAFYSAELRQMIINGQGEMHLWVAKWRLENENKIKIEFVKPRIPYRETIGGSAKADYRHKKQSGGSGQFGEVHLLVEPYSEGAPDPAEVTVRKRELYPLDSGGHLEFLNCIVGGVIDARFIPAVLKGINETMAMGPLTGSPVRDVRVALYDGKMHPVDSNEISFKIAGSQAFKTAFKAAKPKLLEPIFKVEILAPDDLTGEIMTDLQGRRAVIMGMENEGDFQKITARVPLAEMYRYSTTLRSISQGRATHTNEFIEYALVPEDVKQRLMDEFEAEAEPA